jgi:hypothetical protein
MNGEHDKQQSEGQPDQQRTANKQQKGISRVSVSLFTGGLATIVAAYAGIYGNFGHGGRIVSPCLAFLGIVLAALAARLELRNHHWKKSQYNGAALSIAAFGFVLSADLIRRVSQEKPDPGPTRPRFKIGLYSPNGTMELPDSIAKFDSLPITNRTVAADFIVPTTPNAALPSIQWMITNDSDVSSDGVTFSFGWTSNLDFEITDPWIPTERLPTNDTRMRWADRDVKPLKPHNGMLLAPLRLKPCPAISNRSPEQCVIQIIPNDRHDCFWAFWIAFPTSTNMGGPLLAYATNGLVVVRSNWFSN